MLAHRFRLWKRADFKSFCSTSTEQLSRSPVIKRRRLVALAKDTRPSKKRQGARRAMRNLCNHPAPRWDKALQKENYKSR